MSKLLKSIFGHSTESVEETSSSPSEPTEILPLLSMYQFCKDIQERYPDEFSSAEFIKVYFFSDKSVHEGDRTVRYGKKTFTNSLVYIRPELVMFSSIGPDGKYINKAVQDLAEYSQNGVFFPSKSDSSVARWGDAW